MEIQSILTADKFTVFQIYFVSCRSESNSGSLFPCAGMICYIVAVLEGDSRCAESGGISSQKYGAALICSQIIVVLGNKCTIRVECIGRIVALLNDDFPAVFVQRLERYPRLVYCDFFRLGAGSDKNNQWLCCAGFIGIQSGLDRCIIICAV